ncbi:MAG: Y-family DNA polymerase [Chlamydiota bacterium]
MYSSEKSRYYLVDCNQFYVSCEQVFSPKLKGKSVVVLSSNDGCVVARSKEAKALGVPMGAPAYQCEKLFKEGKVHVLSSNYALYGDMSQRVMHVLSRFSPQFQEYSIDEAFLKISAEDPLACAKEIKSTVLQWTGIPVSIGIGPTKTLSKVANDIAKKKSREGIFAFFDDAHTDAILQQLPVEEIWGIGKHLSNALHRASIHHAKALKDADDGWLKARFSVAVQRIACELRGICCLPFDEVPMPRKSVTCSRSFGKNVSTLPLLEEALSAYTTIVAEKLRLEELLPSFVTIFLMTSPFVPNPYHQSITIELEEPTAFTPDLISTAKKALRKIFRKGYEYKKTGITMGGLVPQKNYQPGLFTEQGPRKEKKARAMQTLDALNERMGKQTLRFAAEGIEQPWKMKQGKISQKFTTCWEELLNIKI